MDPLGSSVPEHSPDEDEKVVSADVVSLFSMWRDEKYAPEVLPFNHTVLANITELVECASQNLQDLFAEGTQDATDPTPGLQTKDLERMRYVLRDYLRIRLRKLTQYPQHYLEEPHSSVLSESERAFLKEYWSLKKEFFENRLLGALPQGKLRSLTEPTEQGAIIRRPPMDRHVFAKIVGDVGTISPPLSYSQDSAGSQEPLMLVTGATYLLRYSLVRKFLMDPEMQGKVELM